MYYVLERYPRTSITLKSFGCLWDRQLNRRYRLLHAVDAVLISQCCTKLFL